MSDLSNVNPSLVIAGEHLERLYTSRLLGEVPTSTEPLAAFCNQHGLSAADVGLMEALGICKVVGHGYVGTGITASRTVKRVVAAKLADEYPDGLPAKPDAEADDDNEE